MNLSLLGGGGLQNFSILFLVIKKDRGKSNYRPLLPTEAKQGGNCLGHSSRRGKVGQEEEVEKSRKILNGTNKDSISKDAEELEEQFQFGQEGKKEAPLPEGGCKKVDFGGFSYPLLGLKKEVPVITSSNRGWQKREQ